MVKRLFGLVGKEISDIHDAAYLLAIFTFASQILGLLRDRMLAHFFGASGSLDVYYAAFRIPDLIFVSIGSLVSVSVLIPFLQTKIKEGDKPLKDFVDSVFTSFSILIILVSLTTFFFISPIINSLFRDLGSEKISEIILLSKVLLLSPVFLGISNLFASITQSYRRFLLYALCPLVYNVSIIFGIIFLRPQFGLSGIIYGVVLGAFLHALIQLPFLFKMRLIPDFVFPVNFKSVSKVFLLSIPRTATLSVGSLAIAILLSLASKMPSGSISIFNFSYNLQAVPMSIIGISYSMAAFPLLSTLYLNGEKKKFLEHITVATRHIIFLSLPVMGLFIVLRAQIVRTVLGSGSFSWNDTKLTAACFALFSISAVAQSLVLLFVRAYYASGFTKRPLFINVFSSLMIILFSYGFFEMFKFFPKVFSFFENLFKVAGVPGSEVIALPLGFSLGTILNLIIFLFIFEKDYKGFIKSIKRTAFEGLASAVFAGFGAYIALNIFDKVFDINTLQGIFMQGFLSGLCGIAVAVFVLKILESKELKDTSTTLHRKIWKAPVVTPNQIEL